MLFKKERENVCRIAKSQFDRFLTNAAGGNISMRVSEEHWIMTPTLAAHNKLNILRPEEILVIDKDYKIIEGEGKVTREVNMHMAVYEEDLRINAIIHSHPKEMMVFATMGINMPLITENVMKLGNEFECLSHAPATSEALALRVRQYVKRKVREGANAQYGALLEKHGSLFMDASLNAANDMVERLESNAYVVVQREVLRALGYADNLTESSDFNLEE